MYTSYLLTPKSRKFLLNKFPPKYKRVLADHVTYEVRVSKDTSLPSPADLKVVGYKNDEEGIEALVVAVNGSLDRPDGNTYHVTWSLDPDKFKPKDSNDMLQQGDYTLILPITLSANPHISA